MYKVAGIDVHKKVLMVVVGDVQTPELKLERRRFGTTTSELRRLCNWLREQQVQEAVMESTAQYWKPVWYELEGWMTLHLAQASSNRARRGRKHDFKDAERLVRRLVAQELILSFVPEPEQRLWRTMTRMRVQLNEEASRVHSQVECLLEEMRIKLSSVISDLFGVSGCRILRAMADGESDANQLASLGNSHLRCSREQLVEALSGNPQPVHRELLGLYVDRYEKITKQIEKLDGMIAQALKTHQETVIRLAKVSGLGVNSAQQVIAEVGVEASAFEAAGNLSSWVGACPGQEESAEQNHSCRCAKGNKYMRRILNQAAHAAVKKNGSHFQAVFRRLLPRLGYKGAIWAIAHRLCRVIWKVLHDKVEFIEQGCEPDAKTKQRRAQKMLRTLRKLGYQVAITPLPAQS